MDKKAHFIGIGGIGVSALAKIYLIQDWRISGSDLQDSEIIKDLQKLGAKIFIGQHRAKNVPKNVDLVIYSSAIQSTNPEIQQAKKYQIPNTKYQIPILSYPQALGELTKKYWTIAVSGTHGKGTTTAMLALIMIKAGLDPTVIIGTKLKEFGQANARLGKSRYLLIEADEWRASFLNYWPRMIVLTNIEREHLDYYKNLEHILKTFREYIRHLPKDGVLVVNGDDKKCGRLSLPHKCGRLSLYSLRQKEAKKLRNILKVPGQHNIYNALAALTAARQLGIKDEIIFPALAQFKGTWRRFEIIQHRPYILISDYAHHPTEIKVTLAATREKFLYHPKFLQKQKLGGARRRIICVFQPHQYQRTKYLFKDFVRAFGEADKIILTEIYQVMGREKGKPVSAQDLVREIKKLGQDVVYLKRLNDVAKYLKREIQRGDIVLIMGAGDIPKLSEFLIQQQF